MHEHISLALSVVALLLGCQVSSADTPRCLALFNSDTPAIEDSDSVAEKGGTIKISLYRVNKKTGAASFCAHGDYCYPTSGLDIITPCTIPVSPDPPIGKAFEEEWIYSPY
jgi:hypothetical protein